MSGARAYAAESTVQVIGAFGNKSVSSGGLFMIDSQVAFAQQAACPAGGPRKMNPEGGPTPAGLEPGDTAQKG